MLMRLKIGQDDGGIRLLRLPVGGEIDGPAAAHLLGNRGTGFTGFHRTEFFDPLDEVDDGLFRRRDSHCHLAGNLLDPADEGSAVDLILLGDRLATGIGPSPPEPHEVLEDAHRVFVDRLMTTTASGTDRLLDHLLGDVAAVRTLLGELGRRLFL